MSDVKAVPIMWLVMRGDEPIGFVDLEGDQFVAMYATDIFSQPHDCGKHYTLHAATSAVEMTDETACRTCKHHGKEIFGDRKNTCDIEAASPDELWSGVIDCESHEPEGGTHE